MKKFEHQITEAGLEKLKDEHVNLQDKRPQVLERMTAAREQGDLSENAGYHAAKEELAFIDHRLRELKFLIRSADVIKASQKSTIDLGSVVTLLTNGQAAVFTIVGNLEADPANGKLSQASPIGSALIGKKIGEEVEVEIPDGKIIYRITDIK